MDILHPHRAGLDVNKDTIVATMRCVSTPELGRTPESVRA